jgi:hypothetical protein
VPLHVFFFAANRERLAGVQGGGDEPPGRRRTRRNLRHGALVRSELDWITMKALEKDRDRR